MVVLKQIENMLWALALETGKRYSQKVEQSFHMSMAALEIPADHDTVKTKQHSVVSVMVATDKAEFLVCTLNYKTLYQQPLDLNFNEGEEVTFFLNGEGTVHLTGYQHEDDMEGMDESMFDDMASEGSEEVSDDEEAPELVSPKGAKRKKTQDSNPSKKLKWLTPGGGEESDDSDADSDDDDDFDLAEDDEMDDSDMEDLEDEDDEEEEEDEEDTPPKKVKKAEKKDKTPKSKSPKVESSKKEIQAKAADTAVNNIGPGGDATESKKKKKKKKKNKNKDQDSAENGHVVNKGLAAPVPEKPQTPQTKTPKKQVMAGGTVMEEIRPGNGPVVKKGKMAHVYYVGKLMKNGKQFDSCTNGKPFRFKLGMSEVIQGWDKGLEGMKVGGKRRLTVPPAQAYGNNRSGPIPPNSTLVFEVELKNVT